MVQEVALVTGCTGFIGYHVSRRLLEEGYRVIGLDHLDAYYDVSLKEARLAQLKPYDSFTFVKGALEDGESLRGIVESYPVAYAVNLAGQAGVRYSIDHPDIYIQSNVLGFYRLLETCRHSKHMKHLVYASSSSVYGANPAMPFAVDAKTDEPISLYAATKKSNELFAHSYSHLYGIPTTGLRFFTVYGPWGRPDMAVYKFSEAIVRGQPIPLYNGGRMRRDFTYIDDIVEGVYRVLLRPPAKGTAAPPYRIYNIGNHEPVDLMHMVGVLGSLLGREVKIESLPMQPGDMLETYADIEDLMRDTGFRPGTPIETGLSRFVDWFLSWQPAHHILSETP